ncbi:Transglut_core2 domain-containing protein [Azospirillaceae bacterium]
MTCLPEAVSLLRQIGALPDDLIPLAETALALGVLERPKSDLAPYRLHIDALRQDLEDAARQQHGRDALEARVNALRDVLSVRHGYQGDTKTYDDMQNANLLSVIDRKRGLPVALGILYLHAATQAGWSAVGLNFPGHFLVRVELNGERAILDPFNQGRLYSAHDLRELLKATAGVSAELEPNHYASIGNRDILLRLQNNIKLRHLRADRILEAIETLHIMMLLAPEEPALWREIGLLRAHLGQNSAAISALETFIRMEKDENALRQADILLKKLRGAPE